MIIITAEDVKNEIEIDLTQALGKDAVYVDKWLARQQRHMLNYIALHAWGGIRQAEAYLCDEHKGQVIKQALLEQIEFLALNNFVDANDVADREIADKKRKIAPLARDILANNGLLYTGAY